RLSDGTVRGLTAYRGFIHGSLLTADRRANRGFVEVGTKVVDRCGGLCWGDRFSAGCHWGRFLCASGCPLGLGSGFLLGALVIQSSTEIVIIGRSRLHSSL